MIWADCNPPLRHNEDERRECKCEGIGRGDPAPTAATSGACARAAACTDPKRTVESLVVNLELISSYSVLEES
jgi:hypothetical protein